MRSNNSRSKTVILLSYVLWANIEATKYVRVWRNAIKNFRFYLRVIVWSLIRFGSIFSQDKLKSKGTGKKDSILNF